MIENNFIPIGIKKPKDGQEVIVLTDHNREIIVCYDSLGIYEFWESDGEIREDEKVIGWKDAW